MSAIDTITRLKQTNLVYANLKYCLVNKYKLPFKIDNSPAKTNILEDFVSLEKIENCPTLDKYAGVGISIQASNICAIDIDKCFSKKNDITSADDRATFALNLFKTCAYCEFSFSGTGLRILFKHDIIKDYNIKYYIKNGNVNIEYYQPSSSNRYVTITGNVIADNMLEVKTNVSKNLFVLLNKYMLRPQLQKKNTTVLQQSDSKSFEDLQKLLRVHLMKNARFQDVWFTNAPGSGKDESERDYYLLSYLYENITQDETMLKTLFETSHFFKTKDAHHRYKWEQQNNRYYNYLYNNIRRSH